MTEYRKNLFIHLSISLPLFIVFGFMDGYYTVLGMQGDLSLEGNPIMRSMMAVLGIEQGVLVQKSIVLLAGLLLSLIAAYGIEHEHEWVYWFTLTKATERWMRAKKRRFVAYLPLYLVTLAQALAAISWIYLIQTYGFIE